jgi:hypothetical protein
LHFSLPISSFTILSFLFPPPSPSLLPLSLTAAEMPVRRCGSWKGSRANPTTPHTCPAGREGEVACRIPLRKCDVMNVAYCSRSMPDSDHTHIQIGRLRSSSNSSIVTRKTAVYMLPYTVKLPFSLPAVSYHSLLYWSPITAIPTHNHITSFPSSPSLFLSFYLSLSFSGSRPMSLTTRSLMNDRIRGSLCSLTASLDLPPMTSQGINSPSRSGESKAQQFSVLIQSSPCSLYDASHTPCRYLCFTLKHFISLAVSHY